MLLNKMKRLLRDDSGAVMVLVAMGLVLFLGCMTLVIDAGMFYSERAKASNAVDAAVLAGARELPDDPEKAKTVAKDYAEQNGLDAKSENPEVTFNVSDDHRFITGTVDKDMGSFFARIIGIDTWDVNASATARVGPANSVSGIIPIGVNEAAIPTDKTGTEITLREDPGDGTTGWYGYLHLEPVDGKENLLKDLCEYIRNGYPGDIIIPGDYDVKTGVPAEKPRDAFNDRIGDCPHIPKCTYEYGFERYCPRLVVVPVGFPIDKDNNKIDFSKSPVPPIAGFHITSTAVFLLETVIDQHGNNAITGRFVSNDTSLVIPGEIDDNITTYGVYAAELYN